MTVKVSIDDPLSRVLTMFCSANEENLYGGRNAVIFFTTEKSHGEKQQKLEVKQQYQTDIGGQTTTNWYQMLNNNNKLILKLKQQQTGNGA